MAERRKSREQEQVERLERIAELATAIVSDTGVSPISPEDRKEQAEKHGRWLHLIQEEALGCIEHNHFVVDALGAACSHCEGGDDDPFAA